YTRLVANLAVDRATPRPNGGGNGVHVGEPGGEARFMQRFDVGDIPGVGPRFRARLEAAGVRTGRDVLARDRSALVRSIGVNETDWLLARAKGLDSHTVHSREVARSLSREETFGSDIADDETLEHELLPLCGRAAADVRAHGLTTRRINVKLRDADFRTRRASQTLPNGVIADRVIYETARALLRKLRRARRVPARLLGVALTSLQE